MSEGGKGTQDIAGVGETRAKVAQALGTNRETLRQELFIADNADLLDPADFADWDEGKLSTNKAFQRIKAAQEQTEQERKGDYRRVPISIQIGLVRNLTRPHMSAPTSSPLQ